MPFSLAKLRQGSSEGTPHLVHKIGACHSSQHISDLHAAVLQRLVQLCNLQHVPKLCSGLSLPRASSQADIAWGCKSALALLQDVSVRRLAAPLTALICGVQRAPTLARLAASEPSASSLITTLPRCVSSSSTIPIGRGRVTASTLLGCGRILHASVLHALRAAQKQKPTHGSSI